MIRKKPEKISSDIRKLISGNAYADILHRTAFSIDASIYKITPACVVAPRNTEDIAAVVGYAHRQGIPVVARGAGSGVAGEALSTGIVFDMKQYMNKIISIENDGASVTSQPGAVLDEVNDRLKSYNRKIGPDPSTGNRATIGGCVANNSTGAHSLKYGYIGDYIQSIEAVLADGTVAEFENNSNPRSMQESPIKTIARNCTSLLSENRQIISDALPQTKRNRSGYNIAGICRNGKIDLARMLAGSEGTLAVFTRIKLATVDLPFATGLLQLEFDSLEKAARAVPVIVDQDPSACEITDKSLLDMARNTLPEYRDIFSTDARAVLLVEFTGETNEVILKKLETADSLIRKSAAGRKIVLQPDQQERLWKFRKDAVPLLYGKKQKKRPIPFIEDVSVTKENLAAYIKGIRNIAENYDTRMSIYGHAGDGELHIRPYLDLGEPADVQKMRNIAAEAFNLAWSLKGTISGEHAVGLVRAAFIKAQYGEKFYHILRKIKQIFDPGNSLNPGKIINDDPDIMAKNLRDHARIIPEKLESDLQFEADELALELRQCNGCGLCLTSDSRLKMCPVYRALDEELGTSRAKANIIRFWAVGEIEDKNIDSPEFRKFLDLCINCKACKIECPSGVDVSGLIAAARAAYVKRNGLGTTESLLSRNRLLSKIGTSFTPLSNLAMKSRPVKWLLEKTAGLDRQRQMPSFASGSFIKAGQKYLERSRPIQNPLDKVVYFADTYAAYNDHELGFAVLDILRHNNIDVILTRQRPAPLPAVVYGNVKTARKDLRYNIKHLYPLVMQGRKIICSEPSAALCLKQELRHFLKGPEPDIVSQNTFELLNYLLNLFKKNKLNPPANTLTRQFLYHHPCHSYALGDTGAAVELLRNLCNLSIEELNAGCCGLAGTFGMQKKNRELSSKIALKLKNALQKAPQNCVLTECSACKMQIEHISSLPVIHPVKILARAYGL